MNRILLGLLIICMSMTNAMEMDSTAMDISEEVKDPSLYEVATRAAMDIHDVVTEEFLADLTRKKIELEHVYENGHKEALHLEDANNDDLQEAFQTLDTTKQPHKKQRVRNSDKKLIKANIEHSHRLNNKIDHIVKIINKIQEDKKGLWKSLKLKNKIGKSVNICIRKQQGTKRVMVPLKDIEGNLLPEMHNDENTSVAFPAEMTIVIDIASLKHHEWPISIILLQPVSNELITRSCRIQDMYDVLFRWSSQLIVSRYHGKITWSNIYLDDKGKVHFN